MTIKALHHAHVGNESSLANEQFGQIFIQGVSDTGKVASAELSRCMQIRQTRGRSYFPGSFTRYTVLGARQVSLFRGANASTLRRFSWDVKQAPKISSWSPYTRRPPCRTWSIDLPVRHSRSTRSACGFRLYGTSPNSRLLGRRWFGRVPRSCRLCDTGCVEVATISSLAWLAGDI